MLFGLIRFIVWIAGLMVIAYFVLPYFGYQLNLDYFKASRERCEKKLEQCRTELIRGGIEGARDRCEWKCVDPTLFIRANE